MGGNVVDTEVKPVENDNEASVDTEVKQERVFTRDELAKIAASAKNDGYTKGIRDAQAKVAQQQYQQPQQP